MTHPVAEQGYIETLDDEIVMAAHVATITRQIEPNMMRPGVTATVMVTTTQRNILYRVFTCETLEREVVEESCGRYALDLARGVSAYLRGSGR